MSNNTEKCYNPADTTLVFVDGEDQLDFECDEYKSRRAKMSCGHAVTPMSLTKWCRRLLDQGCCTFVCGMPGCDVEWPYLEVRKMALLTDDETQYFETKMALNSSKNFLGTKSCPGCKTSVMRRNTNNLCVHCTVCKANAGRTYEFCWQCLRQWKGPAPRSDGCDNTNCKMHLLETLKTCPEITFKDVKGVTGCPSIRACPTCGSLVAHNTTQCKNITCANCKVEFCFVCLKLTVDCHKTSSYYKPCSSGVAPRQTSIPVWQKK